jgi:hypothetical protein
MSELANHTRKPADFRRHLLATVSALSLAVPLAENALANEDDQPTVWIEAGARLDELNNQQESFSPSFVPNLLQNPFTQPSQVEKPPHYSIGEEARITIAPPQSSWTFSAGLRYGRANSSGNRQEETSPPSRSATVSLPSIGYHTTHTAPQRLRRFANTASRTDESYAVLDFQAGRDVGLGVFGKNDTSAIHFGLRFAQFNSHSTSSISGDPNYYVRYKYFGTPNGPHRKFPLPGNWDVYKGTIERTHSFRGLGPSLEWNFDALLLGKPDDTSVSFDWGVNGALLFGRQKARVQHKTSAHHGSLFHTNGPLPTLYPTKSHNTARSRSVIVPNIGGFAGLSVRFPNAKVSLGYRADAFFGAMDGSIDVRKTYDRDFYGPFATISIGLGG